MKPGEYDSQRVVVCRGRPWLYMVIMLYMVIIKKRSWSSFRVWLDGYFHEDARRRQQLIFRGLPNAGWQLLTTLDISYQFENDVKRKQFTEELIEEFRRELMHVDSGGTEELEGVAMELLARHQGLPSPLMDWS